MEKKSTIQQEAFTSEEEKILVWDDVQSSFEKNFGTKVYSSWLKNISLLKEYNDYLVLGVPTRFFRDWIVSRYLDKIVAQLKIFKSSINRVEFKILEDHKINSLNVFKSVNKKTPLEKLEDCELLRFLELGHEVKMIKMSNKSVSVDTKENLAEVIKIIKKS